MKISLIGKQIWTVPIMLGLISACGFISALLYDGIGDVLSWIALGIPIVITFWCLLRHV